MTNSFPQKLERGRVRPCEGEVPIQLLSSVSTNSVQLGCSLFRCVEWSIILIFSDLLWADIYFSSLAIQSSGEALSDRVPKWSYALSAGTQLAAMSFSFYALKFVDYPTQALAKACKPIPVMLMGLLVFSKRYHWSKYFTVAIITGGIAVFMIEQETVPSSKGGEDNGLFGIGMLLLSLALDGVTGPVQDSLVATYRPTANHLMFYSNLWASLYGFIWVVVNGELLPALAFCGRNPEVWVYVIGQSLASAVGQLFLYRLIRAFGSLTLSVVTTSRKFYSILLSVAYFGHSLTTLQWTSIFAVFLGLAFDMIAPKARSHHQSHHHQSHHHHHHHHHHGSHGNNNINNHSGQQHEQQKNATSSSPSSSSRSRNVASRS